MTQSTKVHHYPRTLRSVCMVNQIHCQDRTYFYITPPEDAISVESLIVHLKMTFDASIASADRVLKSLAIGSSFPLFITSNPAYFRELTLNQSADAVTRKIDVKIDLTTLLKKDNVRYRGIFGNFVTDDYTYVIIKTADNNRGVTTVATIDLCRVDAQYTTKGIA